MEWDGTAPREREVVTGYKVSFAGITLDTRFKDGEKARHAGEKLAAKVMHEALDLLNDVENE